jgi:2-oxoglutarate dehydrogenase E2 component (dihydrolipoamide succinyltransferase)
MDVELRVPEVGESITEVQVTSWLKAVGDPLAEDDPVVVLESDKVTLELPAPVSGVLLEQLKAPGETAEVGEVIGRVRATEGAPAGVAPAAASARTNPPAAATAPVAPPPAAPSPIEQVAQSAQPATSPALPSTPGREEEAVPMSPMRRRIAERLVAAQKNAALLTTFNEIDMSEVKTLRRELQERFLTKHQIKLGFMSFFVKASIEALKEFPTINAEIRDDHIVYKNYYDVGIAVGGGKGLVVPVLRSAERLSFAEIELKIRELAKRAQENKLELADLTGGTFTISNGGVYGSLLSTPILNPPQSGVLGLHAIEDRAVVRGGEIVIRPMMYVALSYDHRIVDGREAVTFLRRIKELIEEPSRILLEA